MRTILTLLPLLGFCALQDAADLKPGLIGEYFQIGEPAEDYPDVGRKKPAVRRIDPDVNFPAANGPFGSTSLTHQFCVRWSGVLRIPKDGAYTFITESDDGSRLYVDGKQVVDNGGLHAMEEKRGTAVLKAGDHDLRIEYFQDGGGRGCRALWESEDLPKATIPPGALFHRKDKDLDPAK
jgi:hypothetical protein